MRVEGHKAGGIRNSARESTILPQKEKEGRPTMDGLGSSRAHLDSPAEACPLNTHNGADSEAHMQPPGQAACFQKQGPTLGSTMPGTREGELKWRLECATERLWGGGL